MLSENQALFVGVTPSLSYLDFMSANDKEIQSLTPEVSESHARQC
jgi:hypothetical protein